MATPETLGLMTLYLIVARPIAAQPLAYRDKLVASQAVRKVVTLVLEEKIDRQPERVLVAN